MRRISASLAEDTMVCDRRVQKKFKKINKLRNNSNWDSELTIGASPELKIVLHSPKQTNAIETGRVT